MRIRQIIIESLKLPFSDYKSFLKVLMLVLSCAIISQVSHSFKIGNYYVLFVILRSIITIILIGISMNIVNNVVFDRSIHWHFKKHFMEGLKEYVLTLYYLLIPSVISLIFIHFTGLYSTILHIKDYILQMDIDAASLTVMELSHQLPHSMNIAFLQSLQVHTLVTLFLFVLFTSFSFISRILMLKYDSIRIAIDIRNVLTVVGNIGWMRFMKFVLIFTIVLIFIVNILVFMRYIFEDVFISALFEVFLLFFATNAFYRLYVDNDTDDVE